MKKFLKAFYQIIPGKKYFFLAWKSFGSPSEKTFRHLSFHGAFKTKVDEEHSFRIKNYGFQLENEIFWGGLYYRYEKTSLRLWVELCKRSQMIFDVGANSGLYSLVAKSVNRDATVHAFEPVVRVYERMEENVQLNDYNVVMVKKALSDSNGSTFIYDSGEAHEYAASISKNVFGEHARKEVIETVRLDDYAREQNITSIDLMKIDVEGHEPQVLTGMGELLKTSKPTMLVEIVEEQYAQKIQSIIGGLGYLYFDISEANGCTLKQNLAVSSNNNWLICSADVARQLNLSF